MDTNSDRQHKPLFGEAVHLDLFHNGSPERALLDTLLARTEVVEILAFRQRVTKRCDFGMGIEQKPKQGGTMKGKAEYKIAQIAHGLLMAEAIHHGTLTQSSFPAYLMAKMGLTSKGHIKGFA